MKIVVLPGYSPKNKDWAKEIKAFLPAKFDISLLEWGHWADEEKSFSLPFETKKALSVIGDENVYIIAKSVGTRVAMRLLDKIPNQITKLILCGIPTKGGVGAKKTYSPLSVFPANRVLVIQNSTDPLASFDEVKSFIRNLNKRIKVFKIDRSDHSYPYPEDMFKFINS